MNYILYGIVNYYSISFLYYWYHRFLHHPISGILYRYHYIGHHKTDFPLRKIRAASYSTDGSNGWFKTGGELAFGIPMIFLIGGVYVFSTWGYFINFMIVLSGVVVSGESFHSSYHLTANANSHPEGLAAHQFIISRSNYRYLRDLHDIHHATPSKNYGFIDMTMDKIFGTYSNYLPSYLTRFIDKD